MNHLLYTILRPAGGQDYTNKGLSSRIDRAVLIWGCTKEQALEMCKQHGWNPEEVFYLVPRILCGQDAAYAEPLIKPEGKIQMFGGNWLTTSDSNQYHFKQTQRGVPIPIHDRFETQEEYDTLSK